jgi:hypothetical protein
MSGPPRRRRSAAPTEPRYEKGDRVFVQAPSGPRLPGIAGQASRTVEEWRLSPRREGAKR